MTVMQRGLKPLSTKANLLTILTNIMRKFNKALNEDITELKKLHMKKDKTDFQKRKAEVMQKHNISKATVYREMNKDVPGSYKQPQYSNKPYEVTAKDKEVVRALLFKKVPLEYICEEMYRMKHENYSWERIDRIRKEIEKDDREAEERKNQTYKPIVTGETTGEVTPLKNESAWGCDLKLLLESLLNLDKMDKEAYVTVIIKGRTFKLTEEARSDLLRKLANFADADGQPVMDSIDIDTKHLLKEQLRNMKNGMKYGVRDLYDIRKMYKDMGGASTWRPVDFHLLVAVVQHFNPSAEYDDIEWTTEKLSFQFPGCSLDIKPDELIIREKLLKEMLENM
jgi:hypothetical protein